MSETRNIDLGPPADPRDEWPKLADPAEMPAVWKVDGNGTPKEYRLVGRWGDAALLLWRSSNNTANATLDDKWYAQTVKMSEVCATRDEAVLRGLDKIRQQLANLAEALTQVVDAAQIKVRK